MERGDISNEAVPRLLLVWENLLGILPTKTHEAKAGTYLRLKRYKRAVNTFEVNETLAHRIWDITWRLKFSVDVVTWLPKECVEHIEAWIDRQDLPVGHVSHENPTTFARKLSYMPYVAAIYDPDPQHQFTWGAKGRIVSPANPDLIGAF